MLFRHTERCGSIIPQILLYNYEITLSHHVLSTDTSGGIQTLDIRLMSQVFCHLATGAQPMLEKLNVVATSFFKLF